MSKAIHAYSLKRMESTTSEVPGRQRLIDAAIRCFAASGFDVSVRAIAATADVTAGLIRHHFGSKEELRRSCDDEVLLRYRTLKSSGIRQAPGPLLASVAHDAESGALLVYVVRAVSAGGPSARRFYEHFLDETRGVMAEAKAAGLVKPSRDEDARTRQLVSMLLGAYIVEFAQSPQIDTADPAGVLNRVMSENVLPLLEILTHGVLTDSRFLDASIAYTENERPRTATDDEGGEP